MNQPNILDFWLFKGISRNCFLCMKNKNAISNFCVHLFGTDCSVRSIKRVLSVVEDLLKSKAGNRTKQMPMHNSALYWKVFSHNHYTTDHSSKSVSALFIVKMCGFETFLVFTLHIVYISKNKLEFMQGLGSQCFSFLMNNFITEKLKKSFLGTF